VRSCEVAIIWPDLYTGGITPFKIYNWLGPPRIHQWPSHCHTSSVKSVPRISLNGCKKMMLLRHWNQNSSELANTFQSVSLKINHFTIMSGVRENHTIFQIKSIITRDNSPLVYKIHVRTCFHLPIAKKDAKIASITPYKTSIRHRRGKTWGVDVIHEHGEGEAARSCIQLVQMVSLRERDGSEDPVPKIFGWQALSVIVLE